MRLFNAFNRPKSEYSERGSETALTYEYRIDKKTGRKISVPNGETNIYEKIQASLEQSKLENIIRRCGNEPQLLEKMNGQYIDITDAPHSLMEANDLILRMNKQFMELPLEVRKAFDHDVNRYIGEYGTENWANKININKNIKIVETEPAPSTINNTPNTEGGTNNESE